LKILNLKISIFLIWLIHISGALGLLYYDIIFFAALTPINLYLTALLLMINQKNPRIKELVGIGLIFFINLLRMMNFESLNIFLYLFISIKRYLKKKINIKLNSNNNIFCWNLNTHFI